MQLLIVKEDGLYCPVCRTTFNKEFVSAYPDIATKFHNKEHVRINFDTPESYNKDILEWSYPQPLYKLSTENDDLSTQLSTDKSY